MNYTVVNNNGKSYLHLLPGWQITGYQDVIDLVQTCGENGVDLFLAEVDNLPESFFDLRTGLAGIILDRLSVYKVRAGFLVPAERLSLGRFAEMALEANRGFEYHYSADRNEIIHWLEKL